MNYQKSDPLTDATKYLSCANCVLNHSCKNYKLACDMVHFKKHFASQLICVLTRIDELLKTLELELAKNRVKNYQGRINNAVLDYFPAIIQNFRAFEEYEGSTADKFHWLNIYAELYSFLVKYDALNFFEFMYNMHIERTYKSLLSEYNGEIFRTENEKIINEQELYQGAREV